MSRTLSLCERFFYGWIILGSLTLRRCGVLWSRNSRVFGSPLFEQNLPLQPRTPNSYHQVSQCSRSYIRPLPSGQGRIIRLFAKNCSSEWRWDEADALWRSWVITAVSSSVKNCPAGEVSLREIASNCWSMYVCLQNRRIFCIIFSSWHSYAKINAIYMPEIDLCLQIFY